METNKTVFNIGMFSFYIHWDAKGETGLDQRGCVWVNKANPRLEDACIEAIYVHANADIYNAMQKPRLISEIEANLIVNQNLS